MRELTQNPSRREYARAIAILSFLYTVFSVNDLSLLLDRAKKKSHLFLVMDKKYRVAYLIFFISFFVYKFISSLRLFKNSLSYVYVLYV